MLKPLRLIISNHLADSVYKQIMNIRRENFYLSAYNSHYWNGGIHSILSEELIKEKQKKDFNSYFAIATNESKVIKAYARFSTKIDKKQLCDKALIVASNIEIAQIHIIAAAKDIQGKKQKWEINGTVEEEKIGKFFYRKIFEFCTTKKSKLVIADVCIYPVPNIPSLILHKNFDFIPLALDIENNFYNEDYDNYRLVKFVRLIKALSKDYSLERLANQKLYLASR